MPLPIKPTENTDFAIDATAEKIQPSAGLQNYGYSFEDIPVNQNLNYLFNVYFLWITYLDSAIDYLDPIVESNVSSISILEDHVISDSVNGILSFINSLNDISIVNFENDKGKTIIKSTDTEASDPANCVIEMNPNKQILESYSFGSSTGVTSDIARDTTLELVGYKDGYSKIGWVKKAWMIDEGWNSSERNTLESIINDLVDGIITLSSYNTQMQGLLGLDIGSGPVTQAQVDFMKSSTEEQSYGTNSVGISALKLSGNGEYTTTDSTYSAKSLIAINASYGGGIMQQNTKCGPMDSGSGSNSKMTGFVFNPVGNGVQVVSQSTSVSHGTTLIAGTNYIEGPYVSMGGTSWTTPSDERLKTIVSEIENPIDILSKIRTVYGYYNSDPKKHNKPMLIAQNVYDILPNIVNKPEEKESFMGVDYESLIPVLVSGFNYLSKENEELKDKIDLLTERVEAIENGRA